MAKYLEEGPSLEKLTIELSNIGSEFYFAVQGHDIIAYLKLNLGQSQTELQDDNTLETERIYIL